MPCLIHWSDLKIKLKKEGFQLYENFVQLKMQSEDGKYYFTDVATLNAKSGTMLGKR
jgi:hypothetical protein